MERISNQGVKLLGTPIGSKDFSSEFLRKKFRTFEEVDRKVREIDDAQLEFAMFRGCLGFGKINHLLRGCPPITIWDALTDFDDRLESILSGIVSRPGSVGVETMVQSSLPVSMGGLGVSQASPMATAAYVGSRAQTHKVMAEILGIDPAYPLTDDVQVLLEEHNATFGTVHVLADLMRTPNAQRVLSADIHKSRLATLMDSAPTRKKALLRGISMHKANAWIQCPPIQGLGKRALLDEFRTMLKRHLDLDLFPNPVRCRLCGGSMDTKGDHASAFECKSGPHKIARHNHVRDICLGLAVEAGVTGARAEQKHLIIGSGRKPGDIVVDRYHAGSDHTAFDITVSFTLQPSSISDAAQKTGYVAEQAHQRKLARSFEVCRSQNVRFVPLAWESTGGATDQVHSLLERWAYAAADRSGSPRPSVLAGVYARISIAIQRNNARAILDRLSEPPSRFVA